MVVGKKFVRLGCVGLGCTFALACATGGGDGAADAEASGGAVAISSGGGVVASGSGSGAQGLGAAQGSGGSEVDIFAGIATGGTGSASAAEADAGRTFGEPVVTGRYLWSANPESGRVALVDSVSLTTRILTAGLSPTHLAAVGDEAHPPEALVLNTGSSDATRFVLNEGVVEKASFSTHVGANRWTVSPSGDFAVAWSSGEEDAVDPTEGLQEITLADLTESPVTGQRLTVGYRPRSVQFDAAEDRLIVTSEQGISLVELDAPDTEFVDLGEPEGRRVLLTRDGQHAVVRRKGAAELQVVELVPGGQRLAVELPGPVGDVALSSGERVIALVPEQSIVATFSLVDALGDELELESLSLVDASPDQMRLTTDGSRAVLFSSHATSHSLNIVELDAGQQLLTSRTVKVPTPVETVHLSPDGHHAFVVGQGTEGALSGSFAIVALQDVRFPKVVGTKLPIAHLSVGDRAAVVTASADSAQHQAFLVALPSLEVQEVDLPSPPFSTGVLPLSKVGFVSQEHPEGRVTFLGTEGGEVRTLTGFQLSAEVVDE